MTRSTVDEKILEFVKDYKKEHENETPTSKEIAIEVYGPVAHTNINYYSSYVRMRIRVMKQRGIISVGKGNRRTIHIT